MHLARSLQTFVETLFSSVWRPSWYPRAVKLPNSFSWKFFTLLHVVSALFLVVPIVAVIAFFDLDAFVSQVGQNVRVAYPPELVVTIEDGRLSINQDLPYRVSVPQEWREFFGDTDVDMPQSLVLFTRDEDLSDASLFQMDAFAVATESQIYVVNPQKREIRNVKIDESEDMVVDQELIDTGLTALEQVITNAWWLQSGFYVPFLAFLLFCILTPLVLLFRLVQLVIFAFLEWILALIFLRKAQWSYGEVLRMSIFSLTPILVVGLVLTLFGLPLVRGFLGLLLYLIWTTYVLSVARPAGSVPAAPRVALNRTAKAKAPIRKSPKPNRQPPRAEV